MAVEEFDLTLESIERISPSTLEFRFVRDDGSPVAFRPGEFYRFTFTDANGSFERSYTLCNYRDDAGTTANVDLVISTVEGGRASGLLFEAAPGLRCSAKGPYGRMVLPAELPPRVVMAATSVGLAPFLPMLRELERRLETGEVNVTLLLGVRSPDEFIYEELLTGLRERVPGFQLAVCYSRTLPERPREFEREGYVQAAFDELEFDPDSDLMLLCGNPPMVDDAFARLRERGFSVRRIIREKYVYAREAAPAPPRAAPTEEQKRLIAEKLKLIRSRQER